MILHCAFTLNFNIDLVFANNLFLDYFRFVIRSDFCMLGVGWTLYTMFYGESAPTHLREAAGKSLFFCCVGATVGSVSGRKIVVFCYVGAIAGFVRVRKMVVFQVRRNNCRVCKWCLSVRIYN